MSEQKAVTALASVGLSLADESSRDFTRAPAAVTLGSVDFGGWQIHSVAGALPDFPAGTVYLVKVNYDVLLAAGTPAPTWVEAGFEFLDEDAVVIDALPRSVWEATPARRYNLTAELAFSLADDAPPGGTVVGPPLRENIPVPPLTSVLEVLGIGSSFIRWRHIQSTDSAVPPGSQVGWLVLLVPAGCRDVQVRARAGYASTPHRLQGRQPSAAPDTFTVRLPAPPAGPPPGPGMDDSADDALSMRMGFVIDVAGYSQRTEPGQHAVQRRLTALVGEVVRDIGITLDRCYTQDTGDGMNVFLPPATDVSRALPTLLMATANRLSRDNQQYTDRIRLRMAIDFGPVRKAAAGFSGNTVISFGRLVDSEPIREAVSGPLAADLAVLVSDWLFATVVSQGYGFLDPAQFTRIQAIVRSFQADAWLWTSGPGESG